jgi:hypothetical protein
MVMNRTLRERASGVPAALAHGLVRLVRELAPIVLFFFAAFFLILLMFKLFAQRYSIEFSALSKAAVAALILAKVIPLLDWAQSGYRFDGHRRIVVIVGKTLVYGLVVTVLAIGEKIFNGIRETGSLQGGISSAIAHADLDRFFGMVLLFALVVGSYLLLQEIDRAMGKGALFRLLFAPPVADADPKASVMPTEGPK